MIKVKKTGVLLTPSDLEFEHDGVLNPAVIREGDDVHMFYRAVRPGNYSTLGYCRFEGPLTLAERLEKPFMVPESDFESQGVEDPRIVKIDEEYFMSYTGYDGTNARGAVAISKDLMNFTRYGMIVPQFTYSEFVHLAELAGKVNVNYYRNHKFYYQHFDPEKKIMLWDKNVIFFPRRINGKLVYLHRIRPGIQIVSVRNLTDITKDYWENYFLHMNKHVVMDPMHPHEASYIGGGCPPIETAQGWLLIYHGVHETEKGRVYSACAALLDLDDPSHEISRLPYPLFFPEYEWELIGEVNNVCFPTGTALFGKTLFIYYGAADSLIACASVNLPELVAELLLYTRKNE